jgi:hypothetical protein
MDVNGSRSFAHKAASNITDGLYRAGLAEKFREAAAIAVGATSGFDAATVDTGVQVDLDLAADLQHVQQLLDGIAERIQSGDVFAARLQAVAS